MLIQDENRQHFHIEAVSFEGVPIGSNSWFPLCRSSMKTQAIILLLTLLVVLALVSKSDCFAVYGKTRKREMQGKAWKMTFTESGSDICLW